jgi:hypothetical protein
MRLVRIVLDAEVQYAMHHEYMHTAIGFLARRARLTFLKGQIALPKTVEMIRQELRWSAIRHHQQVRNYALFTESMGVPHLARAWRSWSGGGGRVGWWGADGTARGVLLPRVHCVPSKVDRLMIAWAATGGSKTDPEDSWSVVLDKLGVPGSQARRSTRSLRTLLGTVKSRRRSEGVFSRAFFFC